MIDLSSLATLGEPYGLSATYFWPYVLTFTMFLAFDVYGVMYLIKLNRETASIMKSVEEVEARTAAIIERNTRFNERTARIIAETASLNERTERIIQRTREMQATTRATREATELLHQQTFVILRNMANIRMHLHNLTPMRQPRPEAKCLMSGQRSL